MSINERIKTFRKELRINQKEFASSLGFKQSYYSYVESGKKVVTSKLIEALRKKYNVSSEWLYTGQGEVKLTNSDNKSTPENVPSLCLSKNQDEENNTESADFKASRFKYGHKLRQHLIENHKDLAELHHDVVEILNADEIISSLHNSKIGDVLFFGPENLGKVESYKDFKEIGIQTLANALPYKKWLHDYAQATRKFAHELSKIKDEISLDFDFDEDSDG